MMFTHLTSEPTKGEAIVAHFPYGGRWFQGFSHRQQADSDADFMSASRVHRHQADHPLSSSRQVYSQQRAERSLTMASLPLVTVVSCSHSYLRNEA